MKSPSARISPAAGAFLRSPAPTIFAAGFPRSGIYLPHFPVARERLADLSIDFINVVFTYFWGHAFSGMGWRGDRKKAVASP